MMMKIHVRAPFRLVRAAATYMRLKGDAAKAAPNRSIVNVSSVSGLHGNVGYVCAIHRLYFQFNFISTPAKSTMLPQR